MTTLTILSAFLAAIDFFVVGAVDSSTLLATAVAALLSGSLVAAVAAYRKAGPEADAIIAKTLIEVNDHLRDELQRRDEEIAKLRERVAVLEAAVPGGA